MKVILFTFLVFATFTRNVSGSFYFDEEDLPDSFDNTIEVEFDYSGDAPIGKSFGEKLDGDDIYYPDYYPDDDEDSDEYRRRMHRIKHRQQKEDGLILPKSLIQMVLDEMPPPDDSNLKFEHRSTDAFQIITTETSPANDATSEDLRLITRVLPLPTTSSTSAATTEFATFLNSKNYAYTSNVKSTPAQTYRSVKNDSVSLESNIAHNALSTSTATLQTVYGTNVDVIGKLIAEHPRSQATKTERITTRSSLFQNTHDQMRADLANPSTTQTGVADVVDRNSQGQSRADVADIKFIKTSMSTTLLVVTNATGDENFGFDQGLNEPYLPSETTADLTSSHFDSNIGSNKFSEIWNDSGGVTTVSTPVTQITSSLRGFKANRSVEIFNNEVFWMKNTTTHALVSTAIPLMSQSKRQVSNFPLNESIWNPSDGFVSSDKDFIDFPEEDLIDTEVEIDKLLGKSFNQDNFYFNDDSTISGKSFDNPIFGTDFNRCSVSPYPCRVDEKCIWSGGRVTCASASIPVQEQDKCGSHECFNGGVCYVDVNVARCECPPGFIGNRCELISGQTSACQSNPCKGNCKCIESCRHEYGYYCLGEGFTGKDCSIPVPKIFCEPRQIKIDVSRQFVQDFDRSFGNSIIYVSQEPVSSDQRMTNCEGYDVGPDHEFIIPIPFVDCGTKPQKMMGGNGQKFHNRIWLDRRGKGWDMPVPLVDFECSYTREYNLVTSLKPVYTTPQLVQNVGKFSADLRLCKVASCPRTCPSNYAIDKGATYTVGELMHLSVSTSTNLDLSGMVLSVEQLFLSCDPTQAVSPVYLVSKGCRVSSGMFVRTKVGPKACITIQTPRPLSCSTVYLHVYVRSCSNYNLQTCDGSGLQKCAASQKRRRRNSVRHRNERSMLSVIGPMIILNGSTGQNTVKLFPGADSEFTAKVDEVTEPPVEAPKIAKDVNPDRPPRMTKFQDKYVIALVAGVGGMTFLLLVTLMFVIWTPRRNRMVPLEDAT